MMKNLKRILSLVLAAALILSLGCIVLADRGSAYSHDKGAVADHPDWMKELRDDVCINSVSFPGTHDTMAYSGVYIIKDIILTQSMTLAQQLQSGIRSLDIRLDYEGDHFDIYHNIFFLNATFDNVLNTVSTFLREHPTEFIVMRLQQETDKANSDEMTELFMKYYNDPQYAGLFYSGGKANPTVAEMRGKIFPVYSDFNTLPCGARYSRIDCQDYFELKSNWDLWRKWELVKEQLLKANSGSPDRMYMNHLSGAIGSFPYFVASGKSSPGTNAPQLSTGVLFTGKTAPKYPDFPVKNLLFGIKQINFMGTNQLAADFINENKLTMVGIIPADFPGAELIEAIIACNFR